jgi:hypothetical protein
MVDGVGSSALPGRWRVVVESVLRVTWQADEIRRSMKLRPTRYLTPMPWPAGDPGGRPLSAVAHALPSRQNLIQYSARRTARNLDVEQRS